MARKRAIRWAMILGTIAVTSAAIYWNTVPRFEDRWDSIRIGMSKAEVKKVLGDPDNVYLPDQPQSNSVLGNLIGRWMFDSFREKWAYGDRGLVEKLPILSEVGLGDDEDVIGAWFAPKDDDYVIYFSTEGEVVRKVHPYR